MRKHKALKIVLMCIGGFLATILIVVGGFLIFASVTTLKVKDKEEVAVNNNSSIKIDKALPLTMLSWNVGYCGLDEENDFYMDGGVNSLARSKEVVEENFRQITDDIRSNMPDIFLLQEVDVNSNRSYFVKEKDMFPERFDNYTYSFACNFKAGFIPIPLSAPLGQTESGIMTFSKYQSSYAERIQLPIPFSWPISLMNLKRCLLVNYYPIEGSDKCLTVINLHLEAYSDAEGKVKQLNMLMDFMQEELDKGNYVIAGGDFNQTFSNTNYQKYPKMNDWECPVIETGDYPNFNFKMDDTVPTCRSLNKPYYNSDKEHHQYYMIDGFILSNNITVNTFETLDLGFKNTDHNPVKMNINLD